MPKSISPEVVATAIGAPLAAASNTTPPVDTSNFDRYIVWANTNVGAVDARLWQEHTTEPLLTAELEASHWALAPDSSPALAQAVLDALAAVESRGTVAADGPS